MSEHLPEAFDIRKAEFASRRNLPHWRQANGVHFVTFRLADSLPTERLDELRALRHRRTDEALTTVAADEVLSREAKIDGWLHAGCGSCCLAESATSAIIENALLCFDGQRYQLGTYVVMPNHVHVLVSPLPGHELSAILHSWKSFTSNAVNKLLSRRGKLWQDESFDHLVRDDSSYRRFIAYIEGNPAGFPRGTTRLGRGSLSV